MIPLHNVLIPTRPRARQDGWKIAGIALCAISTLAMLVAIACLWSAL